MQYIFIIIMLGTIFCLSAAYVYRKSGSLISFYGGNPVSWKGRVFRIAAALLAGAVCANMRHTSAMVVLHLLFLFLIVDLAAGLFRLLLRRAGGTGFYHLCHRIYRCGVIPVVIFAILMGYGFSNMRQIQKKEYAVSSVKEIGNYRIALLADLHYDTIQDRALVKEMLVEVQNEKPDILLLAGDIVEENTSKESMREIFSLVGKVKTTYGKYYVYGNHDKQPYTKSPSFSDEELAQAIETSGIQILQDRFVEIGEDLILVGRDDAAWGNTSGRKSTKEILQGLSEKEREEKYIVVADHQPIEAEENAGAGADLELSGHTHAGQIWPIGHITEMRGELNYGMYQRGKCKVIVSSGVAGWGYSFRTQGHCEYVMIDLRRQAS